MEWLGYAASLVMGIVLGLMGGGGSILTVPILVYLFGIPPTSATGYSLFVVGATALLGGLLYVRRGEIDGKTALLFALPSIVGVNLARGLIVPNLPGDILHLSGFTLTKDGLIMIAFAALMLAASYSMIRPRSFNGDRARPSKWSLGGQGFGVGIVAGFVGAGGGFLIIPALVLFARLQMRIAIGTSLMIIAAQSLIGFAGDVLRGRAVDWGLLAGVSICAAIGIVAGSKIANQMDERKLKTGFGWFVLAMGAVILLEQFHALTRG